MKELILPNGQKLFYIDKLTALDSYDEIYNDNDYLKHGIKVKEGNIIFDVGANIGLFSRFIAQQAPNLKIFTFEPVPAIFEVLEANLAEIKAEVKNYNIGLGELTEKIEINYYPRVSADSAIIPFDYDLKVNRYVENYKETICKTVPIARLVPNFLRKHLVKSVINRLYKKEIATCQIRPLSEIIKENNINRIDFLKIDAENYESQVLAGILDNDWKKINQISMEVHEHIKGGEGLLNRINKILESKNFNTVLEKEGRFAKMGVFMLYATKN